MWKKYPAFGFALLAFFSDPASANAIVVGTQFSTAVQGGIVVGGGDGKQTPQFVAQGFSLPVSAETSVAQIVLTVVGNQSFDLQLTNAIGPSASAQNVLGERTFNAVLSGPVQDLYPNLGQVFTLPLHRTLGPGEYYLIASSTDPNGYLSWPFFGGFGLPTYEPLQNTLGSVDPSFYAAFNGGANASFPPESNWTYQYPDSPVEFRVLGVPEPSSLPLFIFGVLAIAALGRSIGGGPAGSGARKPTSRSADGQ